MKVLAVLEVMWDWQAMTSSAGYEKIAPRFFSISPDNHTGRRLYWFLENMLEYESELQVTNACPQLVGSANGRGTPSVPWLEENLQQWRYKLEKAGEKQENTLTLVCGRVAQDTYSQVSLKPSSRTIYLPHPAARMWTRSSLDLAKQFVQDCSNDVALTIQRGQLVPKRLKL
jgi:hypothetical protein